MFCFFSLAGHLSFFKTELFARLGQENQLLFFWFRHQLFLLYCLSCPLTLCFLHHLHHHAFFKILSHWSQISHLMWRGLICGRVTVLWFRGEWGSFLSQMVGTDGLKHIRKFIPWLKNPGSLSAGVFPPSLFLWDSSCAPATYFN